MNKSIKIIFIPILILLNTKVKSQWLNIGNNVSSSTNIFGTTNNFNIDVKTNNTSIFEFTTNGDINYLNHNRGIQHNGKYSLVLPGPTNVNTRNTFVGLTHNNLSQPGSSNSLFGYFAGRAASM